MLSSSLNLTHIFTEFRLDIVQVERGIDIRLSLTGHQRLLVPLDLEEAIVIDRHVQTTCMAAQGNMMFTGACEVVQRIRKLAIIDHTQIHSDPATQHNTGLGLALACD